jgi:glutaminyl-peptide cyclotransferase
MFKTYCMRRILVGLLASTLLVTGCEREKKSERAPAQAEQQVALLPSPEFNADTAFAFVKAQVDFGPRVPNTQPHIRCGNWMVEQLKRFNWQVTEQNFDAVAFDGTVLRGRNIIGSYNPEAKKRILLAAHWDTRPFADEDENNQRKPIDGANDGGSGVGVLLEIARAIHLSENKPEVGVDIIFFDAEDYGTPEFWEGDFKEDSWCLGSQHWSRNKHIPGYTAYYGILLDMVGAPNARFAKDEISMTYAPSVARNVWSIGQRLGYAHHFVNQTAGGFTDDHYYVNRIAKIPMIDIIEYDPSNGNYFSKVWHTHNDTIDNIDRNTLKAVGKTVLQTIYQEKN